MKERETGVPESARNNIAKKCGDGTLALEVGPDRRIMSTQSSCR